MRPVFDKDEKYFGACPICKKTDGYLNISRNHWFICHRHKVAWLAGENLFSSWRQESNCDWDSNWNLIKDYADIGSLEPESIRENLETVAYHLKEIGIRFREKFLTVQAENSIRERLKRIRNISEIECSLKENIRLVGRLGFRSINRIRMKAGRSLTEIRKRTIKMKPIYDNDELKFGGCPICKKPGLTVTTRDKHWFVCQSHKLKWFGGCTKFLCWKTEKPEWVKKALDLACNYEDITDRNSQSYKNDQKEWEALNNQYSES